MFADDALQFDYVCTHWYDIHAADFKTWVTKWHDLYNKDIFITEFAPQVCVHTQVFIQADWLTRSIELQQRSSAHYG